MSESRTSPADRPPSGTSGSWVFGWASAAFLAALVLSGLAMPSESAPPTGPPTSRALATGKAIFEGEGCIACHSRMVRPRDRGIGPTASRGMLSNLGAPGSTRVGPDLQNIASRYPSSLLEIRLVEPRMLQPGTLMPSYSHLSQTDREALIIYLEQPPAGPSGWEAVRALNEIEAAVPDQLLASLRRYIDPGTGKLITPIQDTPEFLITGRGLYNNRCAACHGIEGKGDGPASWEGWRAGRSAATGSAPLVPPADFTRPGLDSYSPVMWYWRISEGVPGTEMPAWGRSLSEDALWYLVGYVQAFSMQRQRHPALEPEEIHETISTSYDEILAPGTGPGNGNLEDNEHPADSPANVSEEEGAESTAGGVGEGTASATESAGTEAAEEDSP